MLVECQQCGAPLDVGNDARLVRCSYCHTTNRVRSMRTLAVQAPPQWQPPPTWTPPAHFGAPAAPLPYRAPPKQANAQTFVWVIVAVTMFASTCPFAFLPLYLAFAALFGL